MDEAQAAPQVKYEKKKSSMQQKVYLVFLRTNVQRSEQPHKRLLGVKLNRKSAEALIGLNPGSYLHVVWASKSNPQQDQAAIGGGNGN